MKLRGTRPALAAVLLALGPLVASFCARPCRAQSPDLFAEALDAVRISSGDLSIRADRWPTPATFEAVEKGLLDPVGEAYPQAQAFVRRISVDTPGVAGLAANAALLFDLDVATAPSPVGRVPLPKLPVWAEDFSVPLSELFLSAQDLHDALSSFAGRLTAAQRLRALALARAWVSNGVSEPSPADVELLARADPAPLLPESLRLLSLSEELAARAARTERPRVPAVRRRLRTSAGDVLLSGLPEETFTEEDLRGTVLLLHVGRRSRYLAAPAAAGEGEVRVVVDLSGEVEVVPASGTASGVFGVGALLLPTPEGRKVLRGGDASLGAGLFGVGALLARGRVEAQSGAFSQGAGAFGLGLLDSAGPSSTFRVRMAGQGFGFTRGVGIFRHSGPAARLDGGLVEPDPRDPLAALSMSQGFGYGPRAWLGGGIGIALVKGDDCALDASYMAQGTGYWHSLGILSVEGDRCRVQGRRYVQGAGVHTALGAFFLRGSTNRSVVWGAGPALGWDYGAGFLGVQGRSNSFRGEWATLKGDVNGHSLSFVQGDANRFELPDAPAGAFKRGAPSYGLLAVTGRGNACALKSSTGTTRRLAADPWSAAVGDLDLVAPSAEKPAWPPVDRASAVLAERERLRRLMDEAGTRPASDRAELWLRAAASAGLDPESGLEAAANLLALPPQARAGLVRLVSGGGFDANLWLGVVLPAYGRELSRTLLLELASADPVRRLVLAGFLRMLPVEESVGPALDLASAPDWRLRRAAAGALGALLGRQGGQEPGRLRLLEGARAYALTPAAFPAGSPERLRWIRAFGEQRLTDLYAALSLGQGMRTQDRIALLRTAPNPFGALPPQSFDAYAAVLAERPAAYAAALSSELADCAAQEPEVRKALSALLDDPEPEVVQAAIGGLAAVGRKEDAPLLARFLGHPSAYLRESAAAGLGRMGAAGKGELRRALRAKDARVRALAAVGVSQTSDPETLSLLTRALKDPEPVVRRTALAGLLALQSPLVSERTRFKKDLERLSRGDPDPSVRVAAERALGGL